MAREHSISRPKSPELERHQRKKSEYRSMRTSEVESSSKSTATAWHRTFENRVVPPPARARGLCRGGGDMLLFDLEDGRQPHSAPAHRLCRGHGGAGGSGAGPRGGWLLALHLCCCAEGAGRGGGLRFSRRGGMGPRRVREGVGERGERP